MKADRFSVYYRIRGEYAGALEKAKIIALEQTVEVNDELVPDGFIRDHVIGQIADFLAISENLYEAHITYAVDTTAFELTQFLNVVFGNTSIKAGIRVERLTFNEALLSHFPGPRFGCVGLRKQLGVETQPLLCTALKPMGKSATEIAQLAYELALGGIDLIKDDHGLTDQRFCPFAERVKACAQAVTQANQKTGKHCLYVANITAPATEIKARVDLARQAGAGGLLIAPGLTGFDTMRALAADETVNLPIISHPALLGSMVTSPDNGFSHTVLFGQLQRLAGADASIYPNYGGRFGFSREECQSIAQTCHEPIAHLKSIFPTPGGGMTLDKIPDMLALYGTEVIFLVGGALYSRSPNLVENAKYFLSLVGRQ